VKLPYETRTLFRLGMLRCRIRVVFDTDTIPIPIITLKYVIFLNY